MSDCRHTHNMQNIHTSSIFAAACSRWNEVSRRIELWISIQELNEQGEYSSVELHPGKDISTGGVFQLRQVCEDPGRNPRQLSDS